ncbi:MAG: 1-acyl-sn-glycerol-3-phosphate acyltransferase, partial [Desulfobacterales bacterium]|nr:1-acyl-sn-glycerol-3-phosphate acyltransferase [Desulfobacterales bacterium]
MPFPEIGFDFKVVFFQPVTRIFKIVLAGLDSLFQNRSLADPYKNGYFHEELLNGRSGFLTLVEKKGFYRRFVKAKSDPLNFLIEMQKSIDRPIFIIPQLIFFGKTPHRTNPRLSGILFGTEEKPGKIRRIVTLFQNPGKVFVEISEPMDLRQFLSSPQNREQTVEYQSIALRNRLLDQINRHRQSITGPILKSREELEVTVLTNNQLQKYMARYAKTHNIPLYKAHKISAAYLNEISAKYNIAIIKILDAVIDWFLNIMFEGVTVSTAMLNRIKSLSQKGPLIFIPCHKSHIDYLTLSLILFRNNMPVLHIVAGKNLSFWPLGPIFRGGGAFFIRRSFKGAVLYSKVFSAYIQMLLKEGFNIEFFIEGGRSRTGKLAL